MKEKILLIIIGMLLGAIIATGGFYIYNKSNTCDVNNQQMHMNGGQPPELPSGENPPEMQNNTQNNNE